MIDPEEETAMDETMYQCFLHDLQAQGRALSDFLKAFESGGNQDEIFKEIADISHQIKGAARIVQIEPVSQLAAALEKKATALLELETKPETSCIEAFKTAVTLLCTVAEKNVSAFKQGIEEEKEAFATALKQVDQPLENMSSKEPALPKKEVLEPEPTQEEPPIDMGMMDLFRVELETQATVMSNGLVAYEQNTEETEVLEELMRGAHSIKGAARVVGLIPIVTLAHVMEDCFVALQKKEITLDADDFDILLEGIDLFVNGAKVPAVTIPGWIKGQKGEFEALAEGVKTVLTGEARKPRKKPLVKEEPVEVEKPEQLKEVAPAAKEEVVPRKEAPGQDRILRVTAENLNKLMGLAGESLVESRWLQPFSDGLFNLKKGLVHMGDAINQLFDVLYEDHTITEELEVYLNEVKHQSFESQQGVAELLTDLDMFIRRYSSLSDRLYREVIDSRMRPFTDGVENFPRVTRDLCRQLNKKARLDIQGRETPVDREIIEKLEAPLTHLLRNSIDHGIESPEVREETGKPAEGQIILSASHKSGMLAITVSDDGRGIDLDGIKERVIERDLITREMAVHLSDAEVLDFLFLPGFSTADEVTEISGRGVGLDVVQSMIQEVGGHLRVTTELGKGTQFHLQLPLTLSVMRTLIAEVAGEPYAFPLARIDRALEVPAGEIQMTENRQFFSFEGQNIGLVPMTQILEVEESDQEEESFPIIVMSDRLNCYGAVVDRFIGERELVVQELDSRLGKVPDISAGALMEDGSPVLIVDVEDMVRSIDAHLTGGRLKKVHQREGEEPGHGKKRILVVDDSITVREVECRLLQNHGYEVETAVNGVDGWNAVRVGGYDLVVTDVDMPRMNGIELVREIKGDSKLKHIPCMIVSYKEREEDKKKGLSAGADYYLTKSSFHDETLLNAVVDLIGKAR